MISKEELRIGNIVYSQEIGDNVQISSINDEYVTFSDCVTWDYPSYEEIHPVELTEEILLKCGFEKREDGNYNLFKHSEVDIIICEDFSSWQCDGINFSVNWINNIHQLQNLYYALTNEELQINL